MQRFRPIRRQTASDCKQREARAYNTRAPYKLRFVCRYASWHPPRDPPSCLAPRPGDRDDGYQRPYQPPYLTSVRLPLHDRLAGVQRWSDSWHRTTPCRMPRREIVVGVVKIMGQGAPAS